MKLTELYIAIYAREFTEVNIGTYVYRKGGGGIKTINL